MKRAIYSFLLLTLIIGLVFTSGCVLPRLEFSTPSSGGTLVPTPNQTPPPINPAFTAPPISTSTATGAAGLPDFVSVIALARPSVVAINTEVSGISIFGGEFTQEGAGSGWILDSSGLIVTNTHVVQGARNISVTLDDGRNFPADMVRTDPVSDLAVLKINAPDLPQALPVGDSSRLRVGEWVIAIGNSLGQGISVTKGIVSALDVSISTETSETLYDLIQTDAAINPGNSGGPLINMAGEVVGINSVKVAQIGVEGMGYAISSHLAMPIINELVTSGYVSRPWLGVGLYTVNDTVVLRYRLAVDRGVLITETVSGAPADRAGIRAGDVITAVDDKPISTRDELVSKIRGYNIGDTVQVTYWRGNSQTTTEVELGQSPPPSS
ncbi:MAG: trypsin-like peptidase domain-containing protein [Dehalococcoidales bacterium]|nr:trypsin-like peptidase domain-containing protein [Dehalococcoidales bacterium]